MVASWVLSDANADEVVLPKPPPAWQLAPRVEVRSEGVFLDEVVVGAKAGDLPHVRLIAAPAFGRALVLSRAQVAEMARAVLPDLPLVRWIGPDRVVIVRRCRAVTEDDVVRLLTDALAAEHAKDGARLELHLARPWLAVQVLDEPISLRVLDISSGGLSPRCLVRFELRSPEQALGTWQVPVQARLLADVYVARSALRAGQSLAEAEVALETRDLLSLRDPLRRLPAPQHSLEAAEYVPAGNPLSSRSVRLRPLVRRGKLVDAVVKDGPLSIVVKVEALEDGRPGEAIRVRNVKSRREFRGKVQDENTIAVAM